MKPEWILMSSSKTSGPSPIRITQSDSHNQDRKIRITLEEVDINPKQKVESGKSPKIPPGFSSDPEESSKEEEEEGEEEDKENGSYKRSEDLPADQRRGGVVGLGQRAALADPVEDVVADTIHVILDEPLAFLAESHGQLQYAKRHHLPPSLIIIISSIQSCIASECGQSRSRLAIGPGEPGLGPALTPSFRPLECSKPAPIAI